MKLRVNVKSMGKKPKSVTETICTIAGRPKTVKELILAVVDSQVEEYNQRVEASKGQLEAYPKVLSCLTKEFIDQQAEGGRISFGINYGDRKADLKTRTEIRSIRWDRNTGAALWIPWSISVRDTAGA